MATVHASTTSCATVAFDSLCAKGSTQGASDMGANRAHAVLQGGGRSSIDGEVQDRQSGGPAGAILIVTAKPERYAALPGDLEFAANDVEAIRAAVARGDAYRAVIAEVVGRDGRELGYRLAQLLRRQLMLLCPIFLTAVRPTASARAYAIQCGATKLMRDDDDLVEDLLHFGLAVTTSGRAG